MAVQFFRFGWPTAQRPDVQQCSGSFITPEAP